jgi:hypothetical protein
MKFKHAFHALIAAILVSGFPGAASGEAKNQVLFSISDIYLSRSNYPDRGIFLFTEDESSNLVYVESGLMFGIGEHLTGRLGADGSFQHFFQHEESESADEWDADLLEANLGFRQDWLDVQLGLQPVQFGEGLVFFDNVVAVDAGYENHGFFAHVLGARVFDASPLLGAKVGYRSGPFEKLEGFGLWFQDQDDAFAETIGDEGEPSNLTSEGYLALGGASLNGFLGDFYITAMAAYEFGELELHALEGGRKLDVSAYLFDAGIEKNLFEKLSMGLFCFSASGDQNPLRGNLSAFVSPLPYNSRAAIFFDPGFPDREETDSLSFGGVSGFGVMAPGMSLSLQLHRDVLAEGALVGLYAQDPPENRDDFYGWEMDVKVSWLIQTRYKLFLEAARFEYGDFFLRDQGDTPDPAVRFFAGARMNFLPFTF